MKNKIKKSALQNIFTNTNDIFLRQGITNISSYKLYQNIFLEQVISELEIREIFNENFMNTFYRFTEMKKYDKQT